MKRAALLAVAVILLAAIIPFGNAKAEESVDEMKARVRREVEEEMGPRKEPLPPSPGSVKDVFAQQKNAKPRARQAGVQSKRTIEIPMPFDMTPETAYRFAFVMMFFAIIPAAIARKKGRSFIAWWVLGSLFFVFVLPIAIFMRTVKRPRAEPDKTAPPKPREPVVKVEKTWEGPGQTGTMGLPKEENSAIEVYAKIENLAKLKEKGILTEEEYKAKKNELLSRI